MSIIENLEPKLVWNQFDEVRKIPRCSKQEGKIRKYLLDFAEKQGLESKTDEVGNIVIIKPASPGLENKPIVVLQVHMDMVCEKNSDVDFDFSKDSIQLERKEDILKAKGTTLGADDGIGMAIALAILEDKNLKLETIEALFTVDEETGLTGAFALEKHMLTGKNLLNLDSEDFGIITVGCAGGGNSDITLPLKREELKEDLETIKINISGLKGGHSGVDIHEQRGNAVKLITRVIWKANQKFNIKISTIQGGDKHNAIPREATAVISFKKQDKDQVTKLINEEKKHIKEEIKPIDPDFKLSFEDISKPEKVLDKESNIRLLNLLHALPQGVEKMSYDIPDMVETSTNLAKVIMDDKGANILLSSRSSIMTELQNLRDKIHAIAELSGATVEEEEPYPGWKPDLSSNLLKLSKKVFKDMYKKEPIVEVIHAGLECGIIGEKYPGMEMISIGPTVKAPHSPDERVYISTVDKTYKYVLKILEKI